MGGEVVRKEDCVQGIAKKQVVSRGDSYSKMSRLHGRLSYAMPIRSHMKIMQIIVRALRAPANRSTKRRVFSRIDTTGELLSGSGMKPSSETMWVDLLTLLMKLSTLTASEIRPHDTSHRGDSREPSTSVRTMAMIRQRPPRVI